MNTYYILLIVLMVVHAMGMQAFNMLIKFLNLDNYSFFKNNKTKIIMFISFMFAFSIAKMVPMFLIETLGKGVVVAAAEPNIYNYFLVCLVLFLFSEFIYSSFVKTFKYMAKAKQETEKAKLEEAKFKLLVIEEKIKELIKNGEPNEG